MSYAAAVKTTFSQAEDSMFGFVKKSAVLAAVEAARRDARSPEAGRAFETDVVGIIDKHVGAKRPASPPQQARGTVINND